MAEGFKTRTSKNLINRLKTSKRIGNGSRKQNLKKPQKTSNASEPSRFGYRNAVLWTPKFLIDGQKCDISRLWERATAGLAGSTSVIGHLSKLMAWKDGGWTTCWRPGSLSGMSICVWRPRWQWVSRSVWQIAAPRKGLSMTCECRKQRMLPQLNCNKPFCPWRPLMWWRLGCLNGWKIADSRVLVGVCNV